MDVDKRTDATQSRPYLEATRLARSANPTFPYFESGAVSSFMTAV